MFSNSHNLCLYMCMMVFFFFKQKTAYEMRISDWSSDVCSSDLRRVFVGAVGHVVLNSVSADGWYLTILSAPRYPSGEADQRYLAAVAGLTAMRRAAVRVETRGVRIGVLAQHLDARDPGGGEAVRDIGFEVELRMARAAGGEEALVGGIGFLEAGDEGGIDLVAGARDARADRGGDPRDRKSTRLNSSH